VIDRRYSCEELMLLRGSWANLSTSTGVLATTGANRCTFDIYEPLLGEYFQYQTRYDYALEITNCFFFAIQFCTELLEMI
jgi:hypothetical protein